jgi:uncharacterized protein (TIGR02453 family)
MTDVFRGFGRGALTFLRQLTKNNRREWFQENREAYDNEVLGPLKLLVEEVDVRLGRFAPEFVGDPKRSIFRIHRDVRFSKDKSPYKTHAASWFKHRNAGHGVGSETHGGGAGYYFHLEPGGSMVAGGIWMPPRPTLNQLRDSIAAKPADFSKSMGATGFKRRFGKLSEEAMLTRLPRGFAPGHPAEKWLRYQSFTVHAMLSDSEVLDRRLVDRIEKDYRTMLPFVRWLNNALGYTPADKR